MKSDTSCSNCPSSPARIVTDNSKCSNATPTLPMLADITHLLSALPPGIPFIVLLLLKASIPITIVRLAFEFSANSPLGFSLPTYLRWASYLLIDPMVLIVWRTYLDVREMLEAKRRGAVHPPYWLGKWPGSVDLLWWFMKGFESDYLGTFDHCFLHCQLLTEVPLSICICFTASGPAAGCAEFGPVFCTRFLWSGRLFTTEPAHIKVTQTL